MTDLNIITECLGDGDIGGLEYRGKTQVTKSGKKCQFWKAQKPNQHTTVPKK
jgi:hypothetical protein